MIYLCVSFFLFFSGCGGSSEKSTEHTTQSSRQSPESDLASFVPVPAGGGGNFIESYSKLSLGLRVVPEAADGSDSNRPDPQFNWAAVANAEEASWDETGGVFHRKIFLVDPESSLPEHKRHLFFVWPENPWGSPIRSASFTHRIVSPLNHWRGTLNPMPVWHDLENQTWFIPISEIFRASENYKALDASGEDTQIIHIDLILENGLSVPVEIRFQAIGPIPDIRHELHPVPPSPNAVEFVKSISREGRVVRIESWTNPSSRPFTLWVRAQTGRQALKLHTEIQMSEYTPRGDGPPLGPHLRSQNSSAELSVTQIVAEHGGPGGESEESSDVGNQWVSFTLKAAEVLYLYWRANPSVGVRDCLIPPPQIIPMSWLEIFPQTFSRVLNIPIGVWQDRPDPLRPPAYHTQNMTHHSRVVGGALQGNWEGEVRLVHPFTSQQEATRANAPGSSREYRVLWSSALQEALVAESFNPALPSYYCQGIFRDN